MEDIEQELENNSGVSDESSPETPSEGGSEPDAAAAKAQAAEGNQEANTPFHEHPRFKELVEQKNSAQSQYKALEERYAKMEEQLKALSQPKETRNEKDELIEDLRKIDPRLATRLEQFSKSLPMVENLQQQLQQYQTQQVQQQAVQTVNSLHEANKVSPELKTFINNELDRMYMAGQLKDLSSIQSAYKSVHDTYSKFVDSIKRSERESYVTAKKVDAKVPTSQPKGKPAGSTPQKPTFSKDPEVARQQIVSHYIKVAKAEADI